MKQPGSWESFHRRALRTHSGSERFSDLPFGDAIAPITALARQHLAARCSGRYFLLEERAHRAMERSLVEFLIGIFGQVLELEFSVFRARCPLEAWAGGTSAYLSFRDRLLTGDLERIFREYPAMAQLARAATALWMDSGEELLARLSEDRPLLEREFGVSLPVREISGPLSDRHDGGRSALMLTFACGRKLVYKPKDVSTEQVFYSLVAWLNERGRTLQLDVPRIVVRSGYGWAQAVEHNSCPSPQAIQRYFERAGILLALVYVLNGTDCHFDNLIAVGEHPVIIDAETLFQPGRDDAWWNSVLRTGLLPHPRIAPPLNPSAPQRDYDMSALGATLSRPVHFRIPVWRDVNTNGMALRFESSTFRPGDNVVLLQGNTVSAADYVSDIIRGFQNTYEALAESRDDLLDDEGPLSAVPSLPVRRLVRNTLDYALLLSQSLHPNYLRDPAKREQLFAEPSLTPAELEALSRLDIPRFAGPAAVDDVSRNLCRLSEEDMLRQITLLRLAFMGAHSSNNP